MATQQELKRLRILYIKDFFEEYTDDDHSVSMFQIIDYLNKYGIKAERSVITNDIDALNAYGMEKGMEISVDENGRRRRLYGRKFELAEVKLLIDFVASSEFLPEGQSLDLIKKLETLLSGPQRRDIEWEIRRRRRKEVRTNNKSVLYNIDTIQNAISKHQDIEFQYYQYNMNKEMVLRDEGKVFHVSPRELFYSDNYCYMLAYPKNGMSYYRVDKMTNVKCVDADGRRYQTWGEPGYIKTPSGYIPNPLLHKETVKILFKKDMMDTVIDRFGEDVKTEIVDNDRFRAEVKVVVDLEFFTWIFSLGDNAMIEYPLKVAKKMKDILKERHKAYREEHSWNIYNA